MLAEGGKELLLGDLDAVCTWYPMNVQEVVRTFLRTAADRLYAHGVPLLRSNDVSPARERFLFYTERERAYPYHPLIVLESIPKPCHPRNVSGAVKIKIMLQNEDDVNGTFNTPRPCAPRERERGQVHQHTHLILPNARG